MSTTMNQRLPNLANVSIAILEAKVETVLGKEAIKEIKSPLQKKELREKLVEITKRAEARVISQYPNLGTALKELPIAELPSTKNAILAFYESPTNIETIRELETQIKAILPESYPKDEIVNATSDYFLYIREEMASLPDIREKLSVVSAIRTEQNTVEMTQLLKSIDEHLAEFSRRTVNFDYRVGIQLLKNKVLQSRIDNGYKLELLTLEARLLANLNDEQRFGRSGTLLVERTNIIKELEAISLQMGSDFNSLCQGEMSEIEPSVRKADVSKAELDLHYKAGKELELAGFNYEAAAKYWRIWQLQPEYKDVNGRLQALEKLPQSIFVNRENELEKLTHLLDQSLKGIVSVAFLSGEAGTGKTYLVQEFIREAQSRYDNLVYTTGTCVAQSGIGEPFLPYKEILSLLCGDVESHLSQANISITNARQLSLSAPLAIQYISNIAPNLINSLISSAFLNIKQQEFGIQRSNFSSQANVYGFETAISAFANSTQASISAEILFLLKKISERFPLVIFIDDFQWGDIASVDLLYYLATKLHGARIMLVGAYRSSEDSLLKSPLSSYIRELKIRHSQTDEIDLDKPDEYFVRQFVSLQYSCNNFSPDLIAKVQSHTGGNALFVTELFQYLEEAHLITLDENGMWNTVRQFDFDKLPPKVENVIEDRIAKLEDTARKILEAASVEGDEFTAQILVNLYNLKERKLLEKLSNELEQKWHLVAPARTVTYQHKRLYLYRFRHALVRMYIYSKLSANERELLHRDIALLLEVMYESEPQQISPKLAEHFAQAGYFQKEAKYRFIAAEESIRVGAKGTALVHLDRLEEILNFLPEEKLSVEIQLYNLRGNIYALMPLPEKAKSDFEKIEQIALTNKNELALAQALCGYSILERSLGNFDAALDFVSRAELITEKDSSNLFADCKLLKAKLNRDLGDYDRAKEEAVYALAEYEKSNKIVGIIDARSQIAYAHYAKGQYNKAEEIWKSSLAQFPEYANLPQDPDDDVYYCLGFLNWRLGKYNEAKQFLTKALESATQVDNQRKRAYCLNNLGFVETSLQDYEKAESSLREALVIFQNLGDKKGQSWALGNLGDALSKCGRIENAIEYLRENRKIAEQIQLRSDIAESDRRMGWAYLHTGNLPEAYLHARQALNEAQEIGRQAFVGLAYHLLGEIAVAVKLAVKHTISEIDDPEIYFSQSIKIGQETGNVSEEKASLLSLGKYLMTKQDLGSQMKGDELIQRANELTG